VASPILFGELVACVSLHGDKRSNAGRS